ncbi:hypothetical protein D3C76_1432490 [compost metagenome]
MLPVAQLPPALIVHEHILETLGLGGGAVVVERVVRPFLAHAHGPLSVELVGVDHVDTVADAAGMAALDVDLVIGSEHALGVQLQAITVGFDQVDRHGCLDTAQRQKARQDKTMTHAKALSNRTNRGHHG